jgi:hypothetical protein
MPFAVFMMASINVVIMTMGKIVMEWETVLVMGGVPVPLIRFVKDHVVERTPVPLWPKPRPVPRLKLVLRPVSVILRVNSWPMVSK